MTDPIEQLADALDTLPLAVRQGLVGVVQTFGEFLLDYNRQYLLKGQKPDGTPVDAGGYSPAYRAYKAKYGRNTAFIDLLLTGEFMNSFRLDYSGGLKFKIVVTDKHGLLKKYGELLGIREADLEEFAEEILRPEVEAIIKRHMSAAQIG